MAAETKLCPQAREDYNTTNGWNEKVEEKS